MGQQIECSIADFEAGAVSTIGIAINTPDSQTKYPFNATVVAEESDTDASNNSANREFAGPFNWLSVMVLAALAGLRGNSRRRFPF